MFRTGFILIFGLTAAIAGPYLMSQTGLGPLLGDDSAPPSETLSVGAPGQATAGGSPPPPSALPAQDGPEVRYLAQVLRFDVPPRWVIQNWARVTTLTSQINLLGYRVPLVTGTRNDDLAGSLTYFFNARQQIEELTFNGTTGDFQRLALFLRAQYDMRREITDNPGEYLLVSKRFGRPTNWCRIRPTTTLDAGQPHQRYQVSMNLRVRR